jgi:heptosyltransferase-2
LLLCIKSGIQYYRFPKRNISKILYVLTKRKKPIEHIVTRYADTLKPLGIRLDASGLDFFISIETSNHAKDLLKDTPKPIYALVLGASYPTKMWVTEHIISFIKLRNETVLLLGGISEKELGERIANQCGSIVVNMAGKCNLKVSAALLQQCKWVLTPDTGMMHIAAALHKPIVVLWGNTTPYFGMAPWKTHYVNAEVEGLGCRPCSKIGYKKCPKGHFRCMNELTPIFVNEKVEELLSYSSK